MNSLAIKSVKYLVGLVFVGVFLWALLWTVVGLIQEPPKETAEHAIHKHPKELSLASDGPLGKFDRQQLQRGFVVYKEVCSQCHSLSLVSFRNLKDLGYTDPEVKKIAKDWAMKQPVFDEKGGTWGERPNVPSDRFPKVYYAGTGTPPDLSLITKARHDGAAYVYSLLTGYDEKPSAEAVKKFPEFAKTPEGMHFNPYFANLNIAMPPPLTQDGQVTYSDGTRATKAQMAEDVAAFLTWTAEPTLETRRMVGFVVLGFLLFATILAYGAYRVVWANVKH
ncbi:cytochrome c1 [Sphingomonas sp. R-74633]|uniref:cytochrome c1 n=1 Tax=Sphingomonas sp. R-74633 TaxID=2751188 RepID=UPI0015D419B6|nr:cytochrome c1 [Sphingomonas sp. R-74633]NYT42954.1 cytochrome c1 [Sphingomonas sp. R-74633]